MHGQKEHRGPGADALHIIEDVEAAFSGHADIQNDDVPRVTPDKLQRLRGRFRFAKDHSRECLRQRLSQAPAKHGVVVSDQNPHVARFLQRSREQEESSASL